MSELVSKPSSLILTNAVESADLPIYTQIDRPAVDTGHGLLNIYANTSLCTERPAAVVDRAHEGDTTTLVASGDTPLLTNEGANCSLIEDSSICEENFESGLISRLKEGYTPVISIPKLFTVPLYERNHKHLIGGLFSQMNLVGWEHELAYETDDNLKEYLLTGIRDGFRIVNPLDDIPVYHANNYSSVMEGKAYDFVDNLILEELSEGKYIVAETVPHCIHALGAIPKSGGGFRPITDCKRPIGSSINNYMSETFAPFSYSSVDDVSKMLQYGDYMATVDVSAAYRSVSVHPDNWTYQGITWNIDGESKKLMDTRICFGLRNAPFLYTHISNFVVRCMQRRGFTRIVNYLDDFIVLGSTFEECQQAQTQLISILLSLGFYISWKKCTSPSTITKYLGINFDSIRMELSLPPEKVEKLHSELTFFHGRHRATKRQLQRLAGILSHCAKVVKGARTFSRRIIDLLKGLNDGNPRITLSSDFRLDLEWWEKFAEIFNGTACSIEFNFGQGPELYTDASFSGYGLVCDTDWQAGFFNVDATPSFNDNLDIDHSHWENTEVPIKNINVLELIPVFLALKRLGPCWRNLHVVCRTDNTQVMHCVNKGVSKNVEAMVLLRNIFWLCVEFNIHLTARHVRGIDNTIADTLSRISLDDELGVLHSLYLCCS